MKHASTAGHGGRGRRAYILIIVLGLTVIVTTLGLAFLEANSTVMPEAMNRMSATRARYLAESGAALATHFLMYPPSTVPQGGYWTGATGIAIDATTDYTDVSVVPDTVDPKRFTITAIGVDLDTYGAVRGKQQVAADVIVPADSQWNIPYGLLGMTMAIPATVEIVGDVHANGNLMGLGLCLYNVSAVGTASWPGGGPPASVTSGAATFQPPAANPLLYANYNIGGTSYAAYNYSKLTMGKPDSDALNAIDMSATNPGRIILAPPGDLVFKKSVQLTGTLVVQGNVTLEDGLYLSALPNYPALVVAGGINFKSIGDSVQIVGSVICGGALNDSNKPGVALDVTGSLILSNGFNFQRTDGSYRFTWDSGWSVFWNFETRDPITVLGWKEN